MISFVEPLPIGNAVRILVDPPAGAASWVLLRKTADTFTGPTDPNALSVGSGVGDGEVAVLDVAALTNGVPYFYREYDTVGASVVSSPSVSATPSAADLSAGPDVLEVVRSRIEASLRATVAAGGLTHRLGYVPTYTAPPVFDQALFPLVTVHLNADSPEVRGIGEVVSPDIFDSANNDFVKSEGWLSKVAIDVTGWVLNPDERIALRKALKVAIIGNLPVFDAVGMVQVEASFRDTDDFETYGAPVYMVAATFNCLAPTVVTGTEQPIVDVTEFATATNTTPTVTFQEIH